MSLRKARNRKMAKESKGNGLVPGCSFSYCPGCTHTIGNRLIGQILEEIGILDETILVGPVGCSEMIVYYIDVDAVASAHGRAAAVAVGVKRSQPQRVVISYQGDGDFAAIGASEILNAAQLGESITSIWVNNATYGMTGGQMGPTTLVGQKTKTTPVGRDHRTAGTPLHMTEILAGLPGVAYAERVGMNSRKNIQNAKDAIGHAIDVQRQGKGLSVVEILGVCPTGWGMSVKDAYAWYGDHLLKEFPLGKFTDK
jgi:2-oxoglutarate ferredoxin oxidoreductase subunit beta